MGQKKAKKVKDKISKSLKEHYKDGMSQEQREKISKATKGKKLGPMSDEHKKNLKESFKLRDKKRRETTISKYVAFLNDLLTHGVNDNNCNNARRSYQKLRGYGIDMKPYNKLVHQFNEIAYIRRSRSQKSRNK